MLTPTEFAALLQRYAEGTCTAAERGLVNRWLAQLGEPSALELTAAELIHTHHAMWQRIKEATTEQ